MAAARSGTRSFLSTDDTCTRTVPGATNSWVEIRDAVKAKDNKGAPSPAGLVKKEG